MIFKQNALIAILLLLIIIIFSFLACKSKMNFTEGMEADTDGDGTISDTEQMAWDYQNNADVNKDGVVDATEFTNWAKTQDKTTSEQNSGDNGNLDNNGNSEDINNDPPVPFCSGDGSGPPGCYPVVLSGDVYNYNENQSNATIKDDNYILKTQMVPPVCPSCPNIVDPHKHEENEKKKKDDKLEQEQIGNQQTGNQQTGNQQNINEINSTDINSTEINSNEINSNEINSNEENISTESTNINTSSDNSNRSTTTNVYNQGQGQQLQKNQKNSGDGGVFSMFGSSGSSENDNQYKKEIENLKGEIKKLKQSSKGCNLGGGDECPPCPTPQRCPESAFSCQKIINYKSPNVDNYLPIPILNDFSTFDQN